MDPKLNERFSSLSSQLNSSPTAQLGKQMPSMNDIRTEQQIKKTLEQININQDKALKENWYGKADKTEKTDSAQPRGLLTRAIDGLSAPVRAIVGAVDYATGQSRGSSLGDAINKNVTEDQRLFGDVLKGAGVPSIIAKPAGFVTDVVLDPINIATAGTGGLIARMIAGGVKGGKTAGLKGAATGIRYGAESRAIEAALMAKQLSIGGTKLALKTAALPVSLFNKISGKTIKNLDAAKTTKKATGFLESRAVTATKRFDEIMGTNAIKRAIDDDYSLGSYFYKALEKGVTEAGERVPVVRDFYKKYLSYDNQSWTRVAHIKDALLRHSTDAEANAMARAFVKTYDEGGSMDDAFNAARSNQLLTKEELIDAPEIPQPSLFGDSHGAISTSEAEVNKLTAAIAQRGDAVPEDLFYLQKGVEEGQEAVRVAAQSDAYVTYDPVQNAFRMVNEAEEGGETYSRFAESLRKMVKANDMTETGVAWWDKMRTSVNEFKQIVSTKKSLSDPNITVKERVGQKASQFLDVYGAMMAAFKILKVASSPRAWTNSIMGNLAMATVNGINVMDPLYSKAFKQSLNVVTGKSSAELLLNDLAEVSDLFAMVKSNPSLFEATTGLSRTDIDRVKQLKDLTDRFKKIGVDSGALPYTATDSEVVDVMEKILRSAGEGVEATDNTLFEAAGALAKQRKGKMTSTNQRIVDSIDSETGEFSAARGTDFASNEFVESPMINRFKKRMSDGAKEEGNYAAKLGDVIFNRMPDGYGKIDHVYKLTNVLYTTKYGVPENALRQITRAVNFNVEDFDTVVIDGITRYRITSTAKALELANETFLNYNAMPAAVKLIRQMPLVGAPFIAFTYGMYGKIMKGLIKNPAFFSKQSFALEEMSADTTPTEKALLAMEKYNYLNDPAMIKLPFPGNHMIYMNAANMLPYLSLSLLQPANRSFEEVLPNAVAQAVDKSPFMKDPIGSMIFDFFVMPALLTEEMPLGSFGQPIYPADAGMAEKLLYAGRTATDAFMPGLMEPIVGTAAPSSVAQYLPGYTTRKTAEAKVGNTPLGIQGSESPLSRYSRSLLSSVGVPIQGPVPHVFLDEDEIKDKLNQ